MRKLTVLLLALMMVFGFTACDNSTSTPDVEVPDLGFDVTVPTPDKDDLTQEQVETISDAFIYITYDSEELSYTETYSSVMYDGDTAIAVGTGDVIEICVDGDVLKRGDVLSEGPGVLYVNGEPATREQIEDFGRFEARSTRSVSESEEIGRYRYTAGDGGEIEYDLEKIAFDVSNSTEDGEGSSSVTNNYQGISFDDEVNGLISFDLYYDEIYLYEDGGSPFCNGVCEIKGSSELAGVYSIPDELISLLTV